VPVKIPVVFELLELLPLVVTGVLVNELLMVPINDSGQKSESTAS
jgi:hypothetical protein